MKGSANNFTVQRGAAALATAVILLLVATIIVIYAGKVIIQDQRISGNEYRYKKAFSSAEAGLENRSAFLRRNKETGLPSLPATFNYNTTYPPYFSATITQLATSYRITSIGYASGAANVNEGQATVSQNYGFYKLINKQPDSPLIVAGTVPPVGNMEIVGNSNGGGTGVPVSVWTNGTVNYSGSGATCQEAEYLANGSPSTNAAGITTCDANSCTCGASGTAVDGRISYAGAPVAQWRDVVQNNPYCTTTGQTDCFPRDLFRYVTSFSHDRFADYKREDAVTLISPSQCSSLNANSDGIYWVDPTLGGGNCALPNGSVGGATGNNCDKDSSDICSVVLFTENVRLDSTGGSSSQFFGVIFSFDRTTNNLGSDSDTSDNQNLHMAGSTAVYGVLMSDHPLSTSNVSGSFDLRYNRRVLESITNNKKNKQLARVAGSWIDR